MRTKLLLVDVSKIKSDIDFSTFYTEKYLRLNTPPGVVNIRS